MYFCFLHLISTIPNQFIAYHKGKIILSLFIGIFLLLGYFSASAQTPDQQSDPASQALENEQDSLAVKTRLDSLKQVTNASRLGSFTDSLKNVPTLNLPDSLKSKTNTISNVQDSVQNMKEQFAISDTSKVGRLRKSVENPEEVLLGSTKQKLQNKQDSLLAKPKAIKNKANEWQEKVTGTPQKIIDSLQNKAQKKINKLTNPVEDKVTNKISGTKQKLSGKGEELSNKLNDPLKNNALPETGINEGSLTEKATDITDMDQLNKEIPLDVKNNANLIPEDLSTDELGVDMPELEGLKEDVIPKEASEITEFDAGEKLREVDELNEGLEGIKESTNGAKEFTTESVDKVKNSSEVGAIQEQMQGVNDISTEVGTYNSDLESIAQGDLESLQSEYGQEALNARELKNLQEQRQAMDDFKVEHMNSLNEYKSYEDQDVLKAKLKEHGKTLATSHFGGHQTELIEVHEKIGELKQKYDYAPSIEQIKKRKPSKLRSKPRMDRFVFGVDLEIGSVRDSATTTIDFGPFIGYRFNDRWSAYIGRVWKYTLVNDGSIDFGRTSVDGIRARVDFLLFKEVSAIAVYERIDKPSQNNEFSSKEYNSYMVGINKKFRIARHLYGQGQALLNLGFDREGPYARPYNLRFGFFYNKTSSKIKRAKKRR